MPVREVKTRLTIEGNSEYQKALKQVNSELSTLRSEMKVVDEQFAGNEKSVEALTAKSEVLTKQYDKQKEKLTVLRDALKNAQNQQESATQKVAECREKYEQAQQELDKYKKSSDKTAEGQEKLENAVKETKKELEVAERLQAKAAESIESYGKKSNYTQAEIYKLEKQLETTNDDLQNAKTEAEAASKAIDNLGDKMREGADKGRDLGSSAGEGIDALASAIVASGVKEGVRELTQTIKECTDASLAFESAITGVYKTVDGTPEQLQEISDGIKQMSTEIPAATTEIAGVAEAAGQLGIKTEDILSFTRVMIDLGESTNLSADEAASSLAKFANITGTAANDYSRLGSVIVGLGNNFATTEADIVNMATRLASAGELAGMTEPEIMALAAAMSSVGIEAEAGGTAMTQTLNAMEKAVAEGGDQLELFASVAGMSAREFANRWNNNATSAVQAFVAGLGKIDEQGESAVLVLDELGLSGIRQSNMLKSLALASDQLSGAVNLANTAWSENTALTEEAGKRYETTESKLKMAENAFDNLKIAVGDQLNPVLEKAAETGTDAFTWAADYVKENPQVVGALTTMTTAVGLLAVGVAGYSFVTSAVIPVMQSFTAALVANPVGQITVAIAALVSILGGLAVAFANAEPPQDKYKETLIETRKATDELEESLENLNNTVNQNRYDTTEVKTYIMQLQRLKEQGLENRAVQKLYNEILDKIKEIMPELALEIDETTGALKENTDVLLLNVDALKDQETAVEALRALEDARAVVDETTLAMEEITYQIEEYRRQYAEMAEEQANTEPYSERWWELDTAMSVLVVDTIPALQEQYAGLEEELQLQMEMVQEAEGIYNQYNQTVEDGNDVLSQANAAYATFTETMSGIEAELEQLKSEYEEAYNTAYTNISGQFGLFEQLDKVVGGSVDEMIASLQSQSEYMNEYAANLQRAAELGVNEGLLAELSDGSVESAKYLKAIVDDGGKKIGELNDEFEKVEDGKNQFSLKVAEMSTNFDERMKEIELSYQKASDSMQQYDKMYQNGEQSIQGIIDAVDAKKADVWQKYFELAKSADNGWKAGADQHSPSRVFAYNARMTVEGVTDEVEKSKPKVAETYQQLAGTASGAYYDATQKIQALYAQSMRSYHKLTESGADTGAAVQLTRIADKLDELRQVTEDTRLDSDELASKVGDAVSRIQVRAEAVISARKAAQDMTPEVDKQQGATLSLRKRGVI